MEAFDGTPGVLLVNVRSHVNACWYLMICNIHESFAVVFAAKKFCISAVGSFKDTFCRVTGDRVLCELSAAITSRV